MNNLQRIFDNMPAETLVQEEQRVLGEIAQLQERSQMIGRALLYKIRPKVEYVTAWTEEEWRDMCV